MGSCGTGLLQSAELSARATKEQDMTVQVSDFEAAQTVVSVLERRPEVSATPLEFCRELVRISNRKIGIPPHIRISLSIR